MTRVVVKKIFLGLGRKQSCFQYEVVLSDREDWPNQTPQTFRHNQIWYSKTKLKIHVKLLHSTKLPPHPYSNDNDRLNFIKIILETRVEFIIPVLIVLLRLEQSVRNIFEYFIFHFVKPAYFTLCHRPSLQLFVSV